MANKKISTIDKELFNRFKDLESEIVSSGMTKDDLEQDERAYMLTQLAMSHGDVFESRADDGFISNEVDKSVLIAAKQYEIWQEYSSIYEKIYHALPLFPDECEELEYELNNINLSLMEKSPNDEELAEKIQTEINAFLEDNVDENESVANEYDDAVMAVASDLGISKQHVYFCMSLIKSINDKKAIEKTLSHPLIGEASDTYVYEMSDEETKQKDFNENENEDESYEQLSFHFNGSEFE